MTTVQLVAVTFVETEIWVKLVLLVGMFTRASAPPQLRSAR